MARGARSRAAEGGDAAPRRVACAVGYRDGRIAEVGVVEIREPCRGRSEAHDARPPRSSCGRRWEEISSLLGGAEAVFLDPRRESGPLLLELARRGLPGPRSVYGMAGVVRGAAPVPRGSGPEEIASALGVPWDETHAASAAAENIALCVEEALRRKLAREGVAAMESGREIQRSRRASGARAWGGRHGRSRARETRDGVGKGAPGGAEGDAASGEGEPRGAGALLPVLLHRVPGRPGIYRFFDEEGRLLYVGKAANLRRRLASYAGEAEGAGRRRRVIEALPRVARVEIVEKGTELEALLDEASLIATRGPRENVQREIRERGRRYAAGRARALLLPAAGGGAVSVVFLRDGECAGWCRIGPRGGGLARATSILKLLLLPGGRPPGTTPGDRPRRAGGGRSGAAPGRRAPRQRGRRRPGAGPDLAAATQLVNSWIARYGEPSQLDLDACTGPVDARRKLLAAVAGLRESDGEKFIHR